jgi:hypothetical protein
MDSTISNKDDQTPVQVDHYEDTLEGVIQWHVDNSLWLKEQAKSAKTQVKRRYYEKKLVKSNKKLWNLMLRTPNAYNPLMELLKPQAEEESPASVEAEQ